MATTKNKNHSNPPPSKKSKPTNKMNVDNRDSLSEFQSSIFDASDGHQLVDFIRKKKGLRAQQQKIFDDVPTNRQSLHIEIQRLDEQVNNATQTQKNNSEPEEDTENKASQENNGKNDIPESPKRKVSIKSPKRSNTFFKRLSQTIGRRTLLKEFEKTLQESRFLPPTCSTPLTGDITSNQSNTMKDKIETANQGHLNICSTPFTVIDEETNNRENRSKQTANMAKDLEQQVEFVLGRSSSEKLLVHNACEDSEEEDQVKQQSATLFNRTSTPLKRQTYTIERDEISGNLILSPSKSIGRTTKQSLLLRTPERSPKMNTTKKLIVTPKQKQLLLAKFGRSPQRISPSTKKPSSPPRSRIPVSVHGHTAPNRVAPDVDTYNIEEANLSQQHPETVKIIEQIQRKNTSNVPVIVIPVNQTFNQVPNSEPIPSTTFAPSPRPLEPVASPSTAATAKTPPPRVETRQPRVETRQSRIETRQPPVERSQPSVKTPQPPVNLPHHQPPPDTSSSSSPGSSPVKMNSLRLKDILTDDESSDYHPYSRSRRPPVRRKSKKYLNSSHRHISTRASKRSEYKLSLTAKPSHNSSKVREVIKPRELARMSECEILDLRKRNSRGELRKSLKLTERESSLLGKQMELELLRRSIQDQNYEDEVQMEVVAPPPDEFCDMPAPRSQEPAILTNDEFIDEMSGDKVSLNRERLSQSLVSRKPGRKKKKVVRSKIHNSKELTSNTDLFLDQKSESVERYLETSEKLKKSRYMNLSKRKLYSKGGSEECNSVESDTVHKPTSPHQATKRKSSKGKSNEVPSTPPPPPPEAQPPQPPKPRSPVPQHASMSSQSKSSESVNKSEEFLPQNNKVSEKPVKKARKYNKKPKSPVDPDRGTSFVSINNQENLCRRSKREKKHPTAYWSSTQTEFKPLYDYNVIAQKLLANRIKTSTVQKLVANTKEVKSNRVSESKDSKRGKKTERHNRGKKTKESKETVAGKENEIPVTESNRQQSKDESRDRPQKKTSKKNKQLKEKNDENEFNTPAQISDDPSPNETIEAPVANTELYKTLSDNEAIVSNSNKEMSRSNRRKGLKEKSAQPSKSILSTSSIQGSSGYSSDLSSVQQIRLAPIAEDSHPNVYETNVDSTLASAVNYNRLSRELMPPPASTEFIRKKSSSKVKNSKKSAFRTEHDESIADVSPDQLNKLFDQLKNSSIYVASDVTASVSQKQNNCSRQTSVDPRPTEVNSILERKCKKLAIRVPRMKLKEKSSEKVCDSGFSSEDMSSVPKQKGDVLLNWLMQMIVNGKSTSGTDKGVARFLHADGFHTSSVEDLIFQEIDGVEYAFYDTKNPFSIGYMRFNPKTGKKKCTAKKFELNFVVLSGKVSITVNSTKFDSKNGDLITVFIGTSYVIQNTSNDPALVMVIKK